MQKLVSSAEFAKLAGVNPSTVTRVRKTVLLAAVVHKKIDIAHPDVIAYLDKRDDNTTPPPLVGVDPLYEEVVKWCGDNDNYTIAAVKSEFKLGYGRARKMIQMMSLGNLIPSKNVTKIREPKVIHPSNRGSAVTREQKKQSPPPNDDKVIPDDIEHLGDWTLREIFLKFGTESRFIDFLNATKNIEAINEKRLKNAATKGTLISRRLVEIGVIDVFNSAHLRLLKDGAKSIAAGAISKHAAGGELAEVEAYVTDILGSFIKPVKSKIERSLKEA